jgi:polyisoprenoid-binding protein YceI
MATHHVGPANGTVEVHTYREGVAQKVGHDLIIDVAQWEATVETDGDGVPTAVHFTAGSRSLQIREGHRGVKPLSDKDRQEIRKNIEEKILLGGPIEFRSSSIDKSGASLAIRGELTVAGATRPETFDVAAAGDGGITATLTVTQTDYGVKPFRALMGALKVRDAVDVVFNVQLPVG